MKKIFLILIVFCGCKAYGQGENNIWHFGYNAGVDFNSGSPVSINGGQTIQREGVAAVSDAAGNLLFYSDGMTVWDRLHLQMPNGTGLLGDQSSTQSATIVPVTGNPNQYYLFTCPAIGSWDGIYYSIVDMTLNGGNGDLTAVKNVLLLDSATEQCAVIPSASGCVWFVARQFNPVFYSFLIDAAGINPPVISNCGSVLSFGNANGLGYMKPSPLNNKIGMANYGSTAAFSFFELLDFDNTTGIVSNAIQLTPISPSNVYACEFSPDGTKFYGAAWGTSIYQFDLTAGSMAAIQATATLIGTSQGSTGDMQIGPDQKIYTTDEGYSFLSVIDNPNALGTACNYVNGSVSLNGNTAGIGLPSRVFTYSCNVIPTAAFFAPNHICPGTCTDFINNSLNATSYQWIFPGASPSSSTDVNPANICYNTPGQYDVLLIATNVNGSDTLSLTNFITVYPYPPAQGIIQSGDTLIANQGATTYQWYQDGILIPGATDYFYVAPTGGNYNVVATDANGCEVEAVIFDVVAGFEEQTDQGSGQLTVYPNPADGHLIISYEGYRDNFPIGIGEINGTTLKILIYNMLGETGMAAQPDAVGREQEAIVDVSGLPSGIYYLEVSIGIKTFRTKFVKQ